MSDNLAEARVSALAAGELDEAEAQRVRAELGRNPELARLYGEIRAVRRSLGEFASGAAAGRPGLHERILATTLPRFRALYGPRTSYWPTWLAAAAAAVVVLVLQPPPVRGALEALPRASDGVSSLREAASRQTHRALVELGVLRASLSLALEDRMDRLGDRLRDLERATRRRHEGAPGPAEGPAVAPAPKGDAAP